MSSSEERRPTGRGWALRSAQGSSIRQAATNLEVCARAVSKVTPRATTAGRDSAPVERLEDSASRTNALHDDQRAK